MEKKLSFFSPLQRQLDLPEHAQHGIAFPRIEHGPAVDAVEHHHGLILFMLRIVDVIQQLIKMPIEQVHRLPGRQRYVAALKARKLIQEYRDRLGHVHDGIIDGRGNIRHDITLLHDFIHDAAVLTAENQRDDARLLLQHLPQLFGIIIGIPDVAVHAGARLPGGGDDHVHAFNGFLKSIDDTGRGEQILRMHGHRLRKISQLTRLDKRQLTKTKILHCPADRAYVTFIEWLHQDNSYRDHYFRGLSLTFFSTTMSEILVSG